jgi:hypothetical protein
MTPPESQKNQTPAMKRLVHHHSQPSRMEPITNALRGIIRWVRLLGSPRPLEHLTSEASWITNSRNDAMRMGVTPPIIVRHTFRIRLYPTSADNFSSKPRN